MRAPESPFERHMLKQILFFAYLMCYSVSGAKALKNVFTICHIQFQWKLQNSFETRFKKYGVTKKKTFKN